MVRLFLVLILLSLALRAIRQLANGITEGMSGARGRSSPKQPSVALVRDPVCGTYVVPSQALSSGAGAEMRFFCSEQCRRAYTRR